MASKDPYKYFRIEARELLEGLQRGVAGLGAAAYDPELISSLLRLAHTLKGASRVVKLPTISDLAHRLEDILGPCRENKAWPSPEQRGELNQLLESIGTNLAGIDHSPAPAETPAAHAPVPAATPALLDTVRLQVAEVDAVLAGVAGTTAELAELRKDIRGFDHTAQQARLLHALAARSQAGAGGSETIARLQVDASDLAAGLEGVRQRVAGRAERLGRDLQRLHEDTGRLRLIPTEALWSFLEHTVRDAAQILGRRVRLEVDSRTQRLDTPVFAGLQEALLHLVRNAVAHGIDSEPERAAAGKPAVGRIRVQIEHGIGRLRVVCEDDGRGIDTEAVARAARAKGWLTTGPGEPLGMDAAIRLLLRGGVTTTAATTEMSGRGVGLDVVRAAVARLGGELTINSAPGQGTVVILDVPVTLSAIEALIVESGGTPILLPLESVQRVVRTETSAIHRSARHEEIHLDGGMVPYAELHRLMSVPAEGIRPRRSHVTVVVIKGGAGNAALGVDRLLGVSEAVVRPLPTLADAASFVAGASPGAGGLPRLVFDTRALATAISAVDAATAAPAASPSSILVVDDSLTTRMLEQSILESSGYSVDLAVSGEDALQRLQERRYGLLLVDVEMPGMDGFTLISQIRNNPAWREIPAILVTSRESHQDRQRGLAVGAQDYVIKGEFDQRRLLRRIGELLS
jgi:two-component system, chemotaxis family, sensor kinase CheA